MKKVDITKSNYIDDKTNIFVMNDNTKLIVSGVKDDPAQVYSLSNNTEIVCFEDEAIIHGDASTVVYEDPAAFTPSINNKFVTFGENVTIHPGNKSVNCALGENTVIDIGYELSRDQDQRLDYEQTSYEGYKFLEDTVCFASGEGANIETLPAEYCVVNAKLISTGNDSSVNDYAPSSNNIILSTGNRMSVDSYGCKALFSIGDELRATIHNKTLSYSIMDLVNHQTVISLGKKSDISTDNKSTVIVQEDAQWIRVGINSVLAIMTMVDNRPDFLLFYTENEEDEYPANIAESQKIDSRKYYRLNEHKELIEVSDSLHRSYP